VNVAAPITVHLVSQGVVAGLLTAVGGFIRYVFLGLRMEQDRTAQTVAAHGERIATIEGKLSIAHLE
jgi:hypothetical protein